MRRRSHPLMLLTAATAASGAALALPPRPASAQTTPSAVRARPGAGEIELRGRVQSLLVGEKRLVLEASEVTPAGGAAEPIDPPRPKTVLVGAKTLLRDDTPVGAGRKLTLTDLKPETYLSAVGTSAGAGKPLAARLVRVVEDPDAGRANLLPATTSPRLWTFAAAPAAKAELSADTAGGVAALKVVVTDPGDTERDVHLGKGFLDLVPGHTYVLRFRAKADAAGRALRVLTVATWPERGTGLNERVELGTGWKSHTFRFVANDPSPDKQNALDLWLGQKEGTVWVADASLRDVTRRVVRPVRDPLIADLVADLKDQDKSRRKGAADKLAAVVPIDESREAVADALVGVFSDPDLFVRWSAVAAMKVWATTDTVPALVKKLADPEHAVRWATMESLGVLKDRRAARPLAEMVARGQDRHFAANALRAMGPASVEVAVGLLKADAWEARLEACRTLQTNAGREALPALQAARRDSNGIVRMAADEAIQAVTASGR